MLTAPMGQVTELRAPKFTRAVLFGHCPSGPGLLGTLAREFPLGGGPLPSALICAEMSGGRVWEPARAGGWKSPGSGSSRRGCCFSPRRVVWAGPPCAVYPAIPGAREVTRTAAASEMSHWSWFCSLVTSCAWGRVGGKGGTLSFPWPPGPVGPCRTL